MDWKFSEKRAGRWEVKKKKQKNNKLMYSKQTWWLGQVKGCSLAVTFPQEVHFAWSLYSEVTMSLHHWLRPASLEEGWGRNSSNSKLCLAGPNHVETGGGCRGDDTDAWVQPAHARSANLTDDTIEFLKNLHKKRETKQILKNNNRVNNNKSK